MLMLPATKTRPILLPKYLVPEFLLAPDLIPVLDGLDIRKCRQSCFVAELLDFIGRGGACKLEMIVPVLVRISQI